MKIIEMFGLPLCGKSTLVKKLNLNLKKNYEITNYRSIVLYHLLRKKRLSYFEYFYWLYIEKKRERNLNRNLNNENKKYYKNLKRLILKKIIVKFLPKYQKLLLERENLFKQYKTKHSLYVNFIEGLIIKYQTQNDLRLILQWSKLEIIGYELIKLYPKKILIDSEGFHQRCLGIILRVDLNEKEIVKYINLCPKIDNLFILINKNLNKKKLKKYILNKNSNFNFDRKFIKKYFYLIKILKKKLNSNIYRFEFDTLNDILNKTLIILNK